MEVRELMEGGIEPVRPQLPTLLVVCREQQ